MSNVFSLAFVFVLFHIRSVQFTVSFRLSSIEMVRYMRKSVSPEHDSIINILQNRAAKFILNKPIRTPTAGLFKQLTWLTFTDRCKYHTALLVYKTLHHMAPSYMSDIIIVSTNNNYSL